MPGKAELESHDLAASPHPMEEKDAESMERVIIDRMTLDKITKGKN